MNKNYLTEWSIERMYSSRSAYIKALRLLVQEAEKEIELFEQCQSAQPDGLLRGLMDVTKDLSRELEGRQGDLQRIKAKAGNSRDEEIQRLTKDFGDRISNEIEKLKGDRHE